jgi:Putative zinc-finger
VTCPEIRELFSARADDALTADERARLDAHLTTCADCAREWAGFERVVGLLRAVSPARAPAGFVDRVLAARPRPWYRRLARGLFVPWPVKLPLQAAALVLVAGLAVMLFQRSPELLRQAAHAPAPPSVELAPTPPPAQPESGLSTPAPSTPSPPPPPPTKAQRAFEAQQPAPPPAALEAPRPAAPSEVPARSESALRDTREKKDAEAERPAAAAGQMAPAAQAPAQKSRAVQRLAATVDVRARLAVAEPEAAEHGVRDLLARAGGRVLSRGEHEGAIVLALTVPGESWPDIQRGLRALGTLRLDGEIPDAAAGPVQVSLRLER